MPRPTKSPASCRKRSKADGAAAAAGVFIRSRPPGGLRQASDWYLSGPYVSERQWGTVREDYSADGGAWDYLPHDHARSRAYRWGEDAWPVSAMWSSGCAWDWRCGGDNGAGLGASHQTGWTGLIADVIRRRHGEVAPVGDIISGFTRQARP